MMVLVVPDGYHIGVVKSNTCRDCCFDCMDETDDSELKYFCSFHHTIKPPCCDTVYKVLPDVDN